MSKQRSKYNARKTVVDGITFDSVKEARRYSELLLLGRAGEIRNLEIQPRFPLRVMLAGLPGLTLGECVEAGARPYPTIGQYRADFRYELREHWHGSPECESWKVVVEDVKGFKTPLYRWKKKHVEAQYGIQIREV